MEHALPIGPASEKVWTVLNRVDTKGAPLPGYKGGKIFENNKGVQQTRQEQDAVLGYLQDSGVCDTHPAQNLHEVDLW